MTKIARPCREKKQNEWHSTFAMATDGIPLCKFFYTATQGKILV